MSKIMMASTTGIKHLERGIPNQDYCNYVDKKGDICAVLCDGVSQAYHGIVSEAQFASYTLVNECLSYFKKFYQNKLGDQQIIKFIRKMYQYARKELLEAITYQKNTDKNYYHSTIVIAIYKCHKLYYGFVGDSGLITLDNNKICNLTPYKSGSHYTDSVIYSSDIETGENDVFQSFALMSDGIYDCICNDQYLSKFDYKLANNLFYRQKSNKELNRFIKNQLNDNYTKDDKSIVFFCTDQFDKNKMLDENLEEDTILIKTRPFIF